MLALRGNNAQKLDFTMWRVLGKEGLDNNVFQITISLQKIFLSFSAFA